MSITQAEVTKLAKLARLSIKPEDLPKLVIDLDKVLGYVEKLQSITTSKQDVKTDNSVRLRPDEVIEFPDAAGLVKAAPDHEDNLITTPPIFANRL